MTDRPAAGLTRAASAAGRGGRSWVLAGVLVAAVLLAANHALVRGTAAPKWDGDEFFGPYFTLVADHARAGRILRWDPWSAGGSPDFADPQVAALSPVTVLVGAITSGSEAGFRMYWLFLWLLGPLGILGLARHLGAPGPGAGRWWPWGSPSPASTPGTPSTPRSCTRRPSFRSCSGGSTWRSARVEPVRRSGPERSGVSRRSVAIPRSPF